MSKEVWIYEESGWPVRRMPRAEQQMVKELALVSRARR